MSAKELSDKLGLLNLDSSHKIIVGVDYGTTFTGNQSNLFYRNPTDCRPKAPVM